MLDFLSLYGADDAIIILKHDHERVKSLFDRFDEADGIAEKRRIAMEAIHELKIHAAIEEEIFYPAVRPFIGNKIMNEAAEEHYVARVLMAELEAMDGSEEQYEAKFKVMSECVRRHIRQEERDMLPEARTLDLDFSAIGHRLLSRKDELQRDGMAALAEGRMIAARVWTDPFARDAGAKPAGQSAKAKTVPARPAKKAAKKKSATIIPLPVKPRAAKKPKSPKRASVLRRKARAKPKVQGKKNRK